VRRRAGRLPRREAGDVGIAIRRRALERGEHGMLHRLRHGGAHCADRPCRLGESASDHGLRGRAGKRGLADEHLVQHRRETVLVAARVDRLGRCLLGTHVGRRPDGDPRTREPIATCLDECLGDAEVDDVDVRPREEHVLRLDVAVDDALPVGDLQRGGDVGGDAQRIIDRELTLTLELRAERLPLDVRHRVPRERRPVAVRGDDTRIQNGQDARMLDRGGELHLARESIGADRAGERGLQHLDCDPVFSAHLRRQPYGRHAAAAELSLDVVAGGEGVVQAGKHDDAR
jgi:hypothetical protein